MGEFHKNVRTFIINAAGIRLKLWHVFWQELRGLAATVVLPADDRAEPSCGDTNVHVALFSRGDAGSTLLAVILKEFF